MFILMAIWFRMNNGFLSPFYAGFVLLLVVSSLLATVKQWQGSRVFVLTAIGNGAEQIKSALTTESQ